MIFTLPEHKICCVTGHRPNGFTWDHKDKKCATRVDYLQTMYDYVEKLNQIILGNNYIK